MKANIPKNDLNVNPQDYSLLTDLYQFPTMKQSSNKFTYPGCKQIFRTVVNGQVQSDRLGLKTEIPEANEQSLLEIVMQSGKRLQPPESLDVIRQRTAHSVASLPDSIRQINEPQAFNVNISSALENLRQSVVKKGLSD